MRVVHLWIDVLLQNGNVEDLNARLGLTMVFVSHDLSQVGRVADRVVVLADGKTMGEWDREDFFSRAG